MAGAFTLHGKLGAGPVDDTNNVVLKPLAERVTAEAEITEVDGAPTVLPVHVNPLLNVNAVVLVATAVRTYSGFNRRK